MSNSCPVCGNTSGFVCGTCVECGWNHLDNTFHFIKVYTSTLHQLMPMYKVNELIDIHFRNCRRIDNEQSKQDTEN